ncbi:hypothetical protein V8E54_012643 [Elaphomyces granulatus]
MPALGIEQRQPPPPCHAPRLRASVRRNLSQFELDDVGIEDALGDIEDVLDGRGRGSRGTARGTPTRGRPHGRPPEGLVGREEVAQEAHNYEAYDGVSTQSMILRAGFIA